jgi:hypothetical protein
MQKIMRVEALISQYLKKHGEPPNTGLSGIRMVIFRTLFKSGFRMALAAILLKPFENRTTPVFEWSAIF